MSFLETYAGQVSRLDVEKIVALGAKIDDALDRPDRRGGGACALPYEPGNFSCYELAFTPVAALAQLGARPIPEGIWDALRARGRLSGRWTVVAQLNGSPWSYAFDLGSGALHFVSYVGPHAGLNLADTSAIVALFRAISGVPVLTDGEREDSRAGPE